jgi:hypothetical protein
MAVPTLRLPSKYPSPEGMAKNQAGLLLVEDIVETLHPVTNPTLGLNKYRAKFDRE